MDIQQVKLMKVVLLVSSLASLLILASAAWKENARGEWREIQRDYQDVLLASASDDRSRRAAQSFKIEHQQLYLKELGTIDRCTTCHIGVENPAMADADQPLRTHPGDLLRHHPTEKFGCTICHQGQGRAILKDQAHGWSRSTVIGAEGESEWIPVPHSPSPMLRDRAVYTSCGRCHSEIDLYGGEADLFAGSSEQDAAAVLPIDESSLRLSLSGADAVRRGKRHVVELGCLGCHTYRGRGGVLGPDITYVGDKTKHDFDFSHIHGEHTVEEWLFEHFKLPSQVSPDTTMPDYGLSDADARDLAAYMMSLHRKTAPAGHMPKPLARREVVPVRGETLYKMFCSACHGAEGHGTTMRVGLWPTDADPWGHGWDVRNIVVERRGGIEVIVPSLNLSDTLGVASDDYLRHVIAHGRPDTKMIGWRSEGGLSEDEITLLVNYIRRWESAPPDLSRVSAARGDVQVGAALYRANCAACHGTGGEGGIGNSLNSPTFLAVASDAFLRDTIIHGRSNTAMPAWRVFDGQEISDLLAFIRSWQPARGDVDTALGLISTDDCEAVSESIGRILYKANCVMCHGQGGSGDLGPSLNTQAFLTVVSNKYLLNTLIEGRPGTGMPAWRHLSNEDLASLVRCIRTWQTQPDKSVEWYESVVERGDPDAGRLLFTATCSGCHGSEAEGATGPQLSHPLFLKNATDVMLREWITFGKEGTEMRGFRKGGQGIAELSTRQIEDLVAFLRSLEFKDEPELRRVARSPHGRPEKGVELYARNCAGCHGSRGEGASGPALSNPNFLRFASDGFLMATMALGRSGTEMRPVKRGPQSILVLTSDEINDVLAYLRSWEYAPPFATAAGSEIPHRFVVPWNLSEGRRLFTSFCAGCHGDEGKGSWAPELNNEGFLAAATDGFLQATIIRGRRGTAMRPFSGGSQGIADLSAEDIDNIVAYIRHWSTLAPSPMTLPACRSLIAGGDSQPPGVAHPGLRRTSINGSGGTGWRSQALGARDAHGLTTASLDRATHPDTQGTPLTSNPKVDLLITAVVIPPGERRPPAGTTKRHQGEFSDE
ncbi:MAG: c-type cytochrome [Phycisphaerae bacterium]